MSLHPLYHTHPLALFNSETKSLENISLSNGFPRLSLYTCGPTIYDYAHIGNFRTYVFEDLLKRTLKLFGFPVVHVMNLTDVDDKTIRGANAEKITLKEYTDRYAKAFFSDLEALNLIKADHYPAATDYIPKMIQIIQELMNKGVAYRSKDESIYYDISKCPTYGRLSHLTPEHLMPCASHRLSMDEYDKEHVCDFVLWKAYDPERDGPIYWDSPFGKGRPGWHIECSAMSLALLGETIDIHVGGVDNMFPHHENEIAQSELYTGKRFVRYWLHSEHLLVDNKKMSKSLGNFYTVRQLLDKKVSPKALRFFLLQTHYRVQMNFTLEGLEAAHNTVERLMSFRWRLEQQAQIQDTALQSSSITDLLQRTMNRFISGLAEDLNIAHSLAALFDMVREINILLDNQQLTQKDADACLHLLQSVDSVLGVIYFTEAETPQFLMDLALQRQTARQERQWGKADELRKEIESNGYLVEDTPHGPRLKKK
jgi:cysteinyl-tRNA synthetase